MEMRSGIEDLASGGRFLREPDEVGREDCLSTKGSTGEAKEFSNSGFGLEMSVRSSAAPIKPPGGWR